MEKDLPRYHSLPKSLNHFKTRGQVNRKKSVRESWNITKGQVSVIISREAMPCQPFKYQSLVFLTLFKVILRAMAAAVGRAIDSFFSTIYYFVRYPTTNHHKSSKKAYYYTTNHNAPNTFYFEANRNMGKGRPLSLQTVELKVRMCCTGCERVVKNAILKLRGVDTVDVNLELEKVTVTGYVDRNKVLKEVRRHGKKAEFWPNPDLPLYFTSAENYFRDEQSYKDSYNYWRHGYTGDRHGHMPVPYRGEDRVSNMFNDDDVNACSIM